MPFYHKLGQIPHKRHTQFRKPDGKLYREEVMGLEGFSSLQSILYHHFLPPRVKKTADLGSAKPEYVDFGAIRELARNHRPLPGRQARQQEAARLDHLPALSPARRDAPAHRGGAA